MRKSILAIAALAAGIAAPTTLAARERLTGEQELARLLEGRVAGEPVSCISLTTARESRIIDGTAIVYDAGSVIYVNRPRNPETLDSDDIMVTRTSGSQLCRLDIVSLHDRTGMWYNGFVGLEDFIPWRRAPRPQE